MMKNASNVNFFAKIFAQSAQKTYLCHAKAQMAELVDALVSNTSGFTSMPVRSRLWVLKRRKLKNSLRFFICGWFFRGGNGCRGTCANVYFHIH